MRPAACALFETAIGAVGVAWNEAGIRRVCFPESSREATRARLTRSAPDIKDEVPPSDVARAVDAITGLLESGRGDLTWITLDLSEVETFERTVLDAARGVPPGATMTYGELATRVGDHKAARAVGAAMAANPCPIIVPCHRVLAAAGGFGGFSAPGGLASKARLLTIERAATPGAPTLFDDLPFAARPHARRS